jgi:hypothetical protein
MAGGATVWEAPGLSRHLLRLRPDFGPFLFPAFNIFVRAAPDQTRFLITWSSLLVESPRAFAASRTPFH